MMWGRGHRLFIPAHAACTAHMQVIGTYCTSIFKRVTFDSLASLTSPTDCEKTKMNRYARVRFMFTQAKILFRGENKHLNSGDSIDVRSQRRNNNNNNNSSNNLKHGQEQGN